MNQVWCVVPETYHSIESDILIESSIGRLLLCISDGKNKPIPIKREHIYYMTQPEESK